MTDGRDADVTDRRVDWRVSVTAGTALAVMLLTQALGMEPRLVLVGLIVVAVGAAAFLVADVGSAARPVVWHDLGTGEGPLGPQDRRVEILRTRLMRAARVRHAQPTPDEVPSDEPTDEITRVLLAAIDDHLVAVRGVDRSVDPAGAAAALGPDLARFVFDPSARHSMTRGRSLARTITLIEQLEAPPGAHSTVVGARP